MTKPAIKVEGLWKEYVIGAPHRSHGTFYDMLSHTLAAPLRALRRQTDEQRDAQSFWALSDVNFEVQPGEVVGIIGRNGAGKSTLLKILSRITAPTRGRVEVQGRLASLLEVGTGFHPELSGRENVFLNGAILGMKRAEVARKFDEIVAFAEVDKFIDTPVKRYSSGMYVRLAFAVAAHLEPDVLVVDEVLAVGDSTFQEKCLGKINDVSFDGRTVIVVSHNMDVVRKLCCKVALLSSGNIAEFGDPNQVVAKYLHGGGADPFSGTIELGDSNATHCDVVRIELLNRHGEPMRTVKTWDAVNFRVVIWTREELSGVAVELCIQSLSGTVVHACSTQPDRRLPICLPKGYSHIDCVFPKLGLSSGQYRIGAGISIPNQMWLSDKLGDGILEVSACDVYDSGCAPLASRYLIAADYDWGRVHARPDARAGDGVQ